MTQRFSCKTRNLGPALIWTYECKCLSSKQRAIQLRRLSTELSVIYITAEAMEGGCVCFLL
jgi:hypothetical protein